MLHIITGDRLECRRSHSNEMDCYLEELERDVADGSGKCIAAVEDHLGDFKGAVIAWAPTFRTAYYDKEGVFGPVDYVLGRIVEDDIQLALK